MRKTAPSGSRAIAKRPQGRSQACSIRRVSPRARILTAIARPIELPIIMRTVEIHWPAEPSFLPKRLGRPLTPRIAIAARSISTFMAGSPGGRSPRGVGGCSSREESPNQGIQRKHPEQKDHERHQDVKDVFLDTAVLERPDPIR